MSTLVTLSAFILASHALVSCVDGGSDDPLGSGGTDPGLGGESGQGDRDGTILETEACFELEGDVVSLALAQMNDDDPSYCLEDAAPDARFIWTAPETGRYLVTGLGGETPEEGVEAVMPGHVSFLEYAVAPKLELSIASCDEGVSPTCSKPLTFEDGSAQQAVIALEEGDPLSVVVQVDESRVQLLDPGNAYVARVSIAAVACGEEDLGASTEVHFEGSLSGSGAPVGPVSCLDDSDSPTERSFRFVAPETGTYVANLSEENGEPMALARFTSECMVETECVASGTDGQAQLTLELEADEEVVLVASAASFPSEGYSFFLDVELAP